MIEGEILLKDYRHLAPPDQSLVYPILTVWLTGNSDGFLGDPQPTPMCRIWHRYPSCCFHDLLDSDDGELAGMGLAIIGNICKGLSAKKISRYADSRFELQVADQAPVIPMPWPGMPDDRPVPLDITQLPMDTAMFLDDQDAQGNPTFRYRADRLLLMNRIESIWVPFLKSQLVGKLLLNPHV